MDTNVVMGRRTLLRRSATVGLGGLVLLTGCGAGGGSNTINIVNTGSNNTHTLQELLKQQGYLDEFNLTARTQNVADGTKLMGSLLSGDNDICVLSGFGQVLPAIEKGGALKIVAGAGILTAQAVYTADQKIKGLKDLVGKTVGTGAPGALLHQLMYAVLQKNDIDPSKVKFVNIGSSADVFKAVSAGKVDAGPSLVDMYDEQEKYGVHSIAEMWKDLREYTYQGTYVSQRAIDGKRDALVKTLAAYAKLYRYIQSPESEDDFMRAYNKGVKGGSTTQGKTLWKFAQDNKPYAVDLVISKKRMDYMQDLNVEEGVQKKKLPYADVADMSLARDAVKLLD